MGCDQVYIIYKMCLYWIIDATSRITGQFVNKLVFWTRWSFPHITTYWSFILIRFIWIAFKIGYTDKYFGAPSISELHFTSLWITFYSPLLWLLLPLRVSLYMLVVIYYDLGVLVSFNLFNLLDFFLFLFVLSMSTCVTQHPSLVGLLCCSLLHDNTWNLELVYKGILLSTTIEIRGHVY